MVVVMAGVDEAAAAEAEEAAARSALKRYETLLAVRAKAVKGKGAWYWAHLEPVLVPAADSGVPPKAAKLRCSLCSALFSASNPSRTASEHLKRGTCPNFAAHPSVDTPASPPSSTPLPLPLPPPPPPPSTSIMPLSSIPPASSSRHHHHHHHGGGGRKRSSSSSHAVCVAEPPLYLSPPPPKLVLSGGKEDLGALAMLEDSVKRLRSPKAPPGSPLPKPQADAAIALLADWLHESAGAGAASLSSVDHPKFSAFLRQVGLPPFSGRELAGHRLDARFSDARAGAAARVRDALFFQLAADGWREPVVSLAVNLPNGTSVFHRAVPVSSPVPSDYAEELLLGELGDVSGTGPSGELHRCAGVVADRFKSKALRALEEKHPWMVNLSCQLHCVSRLVRDFARELPLFRSAAVNSSRLAAFFNATPRARSLFHNYQLRELGRTSLLRISPPALDLKDGGDFAPTFAMLDDILASARPLHLAVTDEAYKAICLDDPAARELGKMVRDNTFWTEIEAVHSLAKLVLDAVKEMESDRPLVGQCLPLWEELRSKTRCWCDKFSVDPSTALAVVERRFRKSYHPAWSAAFILDPLYLRKDASGRYLPPFKCLTPEQEKDVDQLITRMVSPEEAHLALMELMKWRSEGLDPLYAKAVQVRQPDPETGKLRVASKQSSRLVWETSLSELRSLGKVAVRLIFLHATARGFRCTARMARLLAAPRHRTPGLERVHRLLFVAANAKFERRDFAGEEDKDVELFAGHFEDSGAFGESGYNDPSSSSFPV